MILEGRSKYVTDFYDLFACAHIDGREGEAASGRNRFHSSHRISTPSLVDPAIRKEANHHPRIGHSNFHKTCPVTLSIRNLSLSLSAVDIDPFQKGVSERNWTRGRGINFDSERRVYRVNIGFAGTILGEKLCFNPLYLSREYVTLTLLPFLEVIRQIYWNWRFVSPLS